MTEQDRTQSLVSESAVLVGVLLPDATAPDDDLQELEGLADTAGCRTVAKLTQRRGRPDSRAYLGRGKVEELRRLVDTLAADVVIFDNDLSPAQTRSLEKSIGVKVIDRTELILDIFASHARTNEARLAVELAQLEYSLPRLETDVDAPFTDEDGGRACAGPAKSSWKRIAGWWKSGFTTCDRNSAELKVARNVRSRRGPTT